MSRAVLPKLVLWLTLAVALAMSTSAWVQASEAMPVAADPTLEARMTRVASELRCLVCQNQTIADSNADLAVDLRRQVREMIAKGASDEEIVSYMTDRYGDFVRYRPALKPSTLLLWFGPGAMALIGFAALALVMRRRARTSSTQFDSDDSALFADPHHS